MRVESAKPCGNGGWLHELDAAPQKPLPKWTPLPPPIDAAGMMDAWRERTAMEWIESHAKEIGVSADSLAALGIAWAAEHQAWAFPMRDGSGRAIGVRLRKSSGAKFAVAGSRAGLFIPDGKVPGEIYICEGPTDTAAGLTLDVFAIGRPSCLGCEQMIDEFARRNRVRSAVIIADRDAPGQRGAEKLSAALKIPAKIFTPSAKDFRAAVHAGLTAPMFAALIKEIK